MKSLIIIAALFIVSQVHAQSEEKDTTTVNRHINIEKEYVPEIQPVKRRNLTIATQEPNITKANISYSSYASNVQPRSNFYPIEAQTQNLLKHGSINDGFAELGIGYPLNWKVEFFTPIVKDRENDLSIYLDHWGLNKGKNKMKLVNTDFELCYAKKFNSNSEFYTAVEYGNDYYNYYGFNPETAENQSIHNVEAMLGLHSTHDINGWDYNARLAYEFMYLQFYKNHEHSIDLDGFIAKTFGHNPLNIGLVMNFSYLNMQKEMTGTIGLTPSYTWNWDALSFKLGAKVYFALNHGRVVNAMPDVKISYTAGKIFNIYGGVTGNYEINKLSETFKECRYFDYTSTGYIKNQYTPADVFIGVKVKPISGFMINLHANYRYTMDEHFIRNIFAGDSIKNMFTADYANMQHLNVGLRLNYNLKDKYIIHAGVKYNYYKVASDSIQAWNRPAWEISAGTEMNPLKGLSLTADFIVRTGYITPKNMKLDTKKLTNHYILNIGAGYTFKKQYTVFAELNNLLGFGKLVYEDWYGYENVGFNFLAGIKINF